MTPVKAVRVGVGVYQKSYRSLDYDKSLGAVDGSLSIDNLIPMGGGCRSPVD